jgi:hypothetical protein
MHQDPLWSKATGEDLGPSVISMVEIKDKYIKSTVLNLVAENRSFGIAF